MTEVLHLSARDNQGGAARATYRLHQGLRGIGVNSQMLVQKKVTTDRTVQGPGGTFGDIYDIVRRKLDELPVRRYPYRNPEIFSPGWLPERRNVAVNDKNPEIVNLHWVAGGFLRPQTLKKFNAPIVWTLHDMWPFTGGCHYAGDCTKYKQSCGTCPNLGSDDPTDLSRSTWNRKREAWEDLSLSLVAPSQWLADCARESSLFGGTNVEIIPNGLDIESFRPHQSNDVRKMLGFEPDSKLIGFGADWNTPRKGMDLLYDALRKLDYSNGSVEVAVFGHTGQTGVKELDLQVNYLGYIPDGLLRLLYSEADAMIVPSRQEAFGQTASEAMASGTPVVAFDATGLRDIVDHKETGYLAEPFDKTDLARGIEWVLAEEDRRKGLSERAREIAVERFSIETVAHQYQDLYDQVR